MNLNYYFFHPDMLEKKTLRFLVPFSIVPLNNNAATIQWYTYSKRFHLFKVTAKTLESILLHLFNDIYKALQTQLL